MAISQEQFRKIFTQALVAIYKERIPAPGFLRSFFPDQTNATRYISIEVKRGTEKVAVDVARAASDGNLNEMTKSTQKVIEPPLYWEYVNATDHRLYDQAVGQQGQTAFRQLMRELAEEQIMVRDKIERAYEVQASNVLEDGIVQLKNGDQIDYKRKGDSLVDVSSSNPWSTTSNDPLENLQAAGDFLRQKGKVQGGTINVIMGSDAFNAFLKTDSVKNLSDLRRVSIMEIREPQRNAQGGVLHGTVSAGPYRFNIWTYPEFYEDTQGNMQPYVNPKKIVCLPENPRFAFEFGAPPQLIGRDGTVPQTGSYYVYDYMNERAATHEIHTKSAGVAVPIAVDQMYTAKVLA